MFGLIKSLIGYTGSQTNFDSTYMYCAAAMTIILLVIFTEFLYRLLRSFIRK